MNQARRPRLGPRAANGFTLLEVLIASVLLAIISAGTHTLFTASYQFQLTGQRRLEAMYLAREQMEQLQAMSYYSLSTLTPNPTTQTLPGGIGTRTICVSTNPACPQPPAGADYLAVTVTVVRND